MAVLSGLSGAANSFNLGGFCMYNPGGIQNWLIVSILQSFKEPTL
jgi:hypothetical protein